MEQSGIYNTIRQFANENNENSQCSFNWSQMKAQNRKFTLELVKSLGLVHDLETEDDGDTFLIVTKNEDLDDESDEENSAARQRVFKKYDNAKVETVISAEDVTESKANEVDKKYTDWKWDYYREKLEFTGRDESKVKKLVYTYVEGLQWVLLYYYHGVPSWEWFYPYHYSPKISGIYY